MRQGIALNGALLNRCSVSFSALVGTLWALACHLLFETSTAFSGHRSGTTELGVSAWFQLVSGILFQFPATWFLHHQFSLAP
jgi:hypothetical protein